MMLCPTSLYMNPHFPTYILLLYNVLFISIIQSLFINPKKYSISAILACGGKSNRFIDSGGNDIKQFNCINNIPIYLFSFYELLKHKQIKHIILLTYKNKFNYIINDLYTKLPILNGNINDSITKNGKLPSVDNNYFYYYNNKIIGKSDPNWQQIEKLYTEETSPPFTIVKITLAESAARSRKWTVINGLRHVGESDLVLVHDSARPLIYTINLDKMIDLACRKGSSVPFIRVNDAVKEHSGHKTIKNAVDRELLVLVQTPQIFKSKMIKLAYEMAGKDEKESYDCSGYVERYCNERVNLIPGHLYNMKITTLSDYKLARYLLLERYFNSATHNL